MIRWMGEGTPPKAVFFDLPAYLRQVEREHIGQALEAANGNRAAAARALGLRRTTLVMRMKALGMTTICEVKAA